MSYVVKVPYHGAQTITVDAGSTEEAQEIAAEQALEGPQIIDGNHLSFWRTEEDTNYMDSSGFTAYLEDPGDPTTWELS